MIWSKKFQGDRRTDSRDLWLGIVVSLLLHGTLVLTYDRWIQVFQPRAERRSQTPPIPIEFVEVPRQEQKPPPETQRRAANDSVAGGTARARQPLAARTAPPTAPRTRGSRPARSPQPEAAQSTAVLPPASRQQLRSRLRRNSAAPTAPKPQPQERIAAAAPNIPKPNPTPNPEPKPLKPSSSSAPVTPRSPAKTQRTAARSPSRSGAASKLGGPVNLSSRDLAALPNSNRFNRRAAGIDARRDVDMGSYLMQLQQQVRQQWIPGMTQNSRRTVIFFSVTRSGRVTGMQIVRPSGSRAADTAALGAIQRAAPFAPLPAGFAANTLNIRFTFNINVSGQLELWAR